ncbi:hypothetical protein N0V83_004207 [Neocucurbitaria cava]|uniref:Agglutinin-like protein n=1 Tax=Neocucurbitaria cava TaxID=798079 RepID=A0A9W8YAP2_9PLEO|nr:hypothetical protein N0V83_004207 [Neocucurbitaria cava]
MLYRLRAVFIGALGLKLASLVHADYQEIWDNQRGLCTFDFDNPSGYFAYNGAGIEDETASTGVGSGADDHPFIVYCKFHFRDQADVVTQSVTYRNNAIVPTVVVPFTDAPVTSLVPGSNAECTVYPGSSILQGFDLEETYALNSATPIPPFLTSTIVVVPTSAVTTTTSTSTLTQPTETTVTPDTVTSTVATGTRTVLGKSTLTTKTVTITPWARTVKKVAITYSTTTLSCIPPKKQRRSTRGDRALAAARDVFARQDNTNVETATCYGQQVTPTVINTVFTTSTTSTETIVEQTLTTTTVVNTVTAPVPTAIQNVQATTTFTPTFTRYRWTLLPRATFTSTISITNTVTKLPKTALTPCVKPTATPQPISGGAQCKSPTTTVKNGCQKVMCH